MLKRKLPIGIEDYREMINKNFYYIDKTLLMKAVYGKNVNGKSVKRRHYGKNSRNRVTKF